MNTEENKKVNIPDEISAEKNPRWAWKQGYEQGVRDERERILSKLPLGQRSDFEMNEMEEQVEQNRDLPF